MAPSVSQVQAARDRRDQMMLAMAKDASRIKTKAREARHKGTRQVGYRAVRYQRFQGRRGEVLEKESRDRVRIRRARSIRLMATWLEAQALVNAEEGTPREEPVAVRGGVLEPGQSLLSSFWS